jgi:hypothetical protein
MWLSITSQYQQGTAERRQSLNQAFLNYKFKADHSVRTHIEAIKLLAKNYKDAGGQTTEDEIINRILTSLPPSYDNFIAPWESTAKAERTLANLTTRLCSQEERTNLRSGGQKSTDDKAFFGETPQQSSRSASNPNSNRAANRRFRPYPRGRGRGRGLGNRNVRFAEANGSPRRQGKCWNCNGTGHWQNECWAEKVENPEAESAKAEDTEDVDGKAAVNQSIPTGSHDKFFLDSGATKNMSFQRRFFTNFKDLRFNLEHDGLAASDITELKF